MIEINVWIELVFNSYIYATEFFFFYLFGKGDFKSNHPVIIFVFSKYLVRKPSLYSCWNFLEMYHGRVQKKFTANWTRSTTYIYVTSTFVFRMLFPGFPWSVWFAFGIYPSIVLTVYVTRPQIVFSLSLSKFIYLRTQPVFAA